MSFILDALKRVEELRGPKTAALSRAAITPPAPNRLPRRTLLHISLGGLGACALAYGYLYLHQQAMPGAAASRPKPAAAVSDAASQTLASGDIPTMLSSADAARAAPEPPASAPRASPARTSKARVASVRKPAKFNPPTTLSQPLPTPSPSAAMAGASERGKVPPLPLAGLSDMASAASAPTTRNPLDDLRPLNALPLELQALVQQMKIRVHLYAPLRRQRFVLIDGRQLREGDELFAGLHVDEITRAGMILQHKGTRVLAPAPAGR